MMKCKLCQTEALGLSCGTCACVIGVPENCFYVQNYTCFTQTCQTENF